MPSSYIMIESSPYSSKIADLWKFNIVLSLKCNMTSGVQFIRQINFKKFVYHWLLRRNLSE